MTKLLPTLLVLTIVSCAEKQSQVELPAKADSSAASFAFIPANGPGDTSNQEPSLELSEQDETMTCYVVVGDTGAHYYELREQMLGYQTMLGQEVDTLGRGYDKSKDLIALPENDEDEIYAGDYYPRRYPSSTLSLEYLNFYQESASKKSIALVTAIYERKESADSALTILKKVQPRAFVVKSDIYMGCMH